MCEVNKLLDITVQGNLNLLSAALPGMRDRGYGRIILASSVLAEKVQVGTGVYSAAKCFVDSLVRTASVENIGKGVTCNSLRLGYFDGGICHDIPKKYADPIRESIGLKRWGSIEELYNIVQFLIKTEYITGQNLNVSGGI
jgi:NAD(P)-dependent dehydrogenase (short-subunit alcohol dehydrogenase family)